MGRSREGWEADETRPLRQGPSPTPSPHTPPPPSCLLLSCDGLVRENLIPVGIRRYWKRDKI